MATKQKHFPHPRDARLSAGMTWRGMAKKGLGQATISRAEASGAYPATRGTRMLYLSVLGLPTDNLDLPVAKLKAAKP
jgi:hypothetical protein